MISYIISYDDYSLALEKVNEIHNSIKDYEKDIIDLEDEGLYSLVDELTTISLFSSPKLVIAKNADLIINTKSDNAINDLIKALNDVDNLNCVIFLVGSAKISDNETFKKIKKISSHIDVNLKDISLENYALNSFNKDDFKIDKESLTLLVNNANSFEFLRTAIDKLKCYKFDEKQITIKDVYAMVQRPLDNNVFDLVNAVISKDKLRIFQIYNDLKKASITSSYLIALILNKFQEMYNVSILSRARLSQQDIADLYKVSSGRVYYMLKNSKTTTIEGITKNLDLLNDLDIRIKQGLIDQNIGLELYLLR